ncbi:MAG: Alanine--tRNA ligase [Candidatus Bathyarchaeota archaeon BA1]|nr:MAG: Alanine--tRNA ligase [Candidatus Bathyarchaeota archaeon BA1]
MGEVKVPPDVERDIIGLPRTKPIYYDDPYLREFESKVLKVVSFEDSCYVVLDGTCFFPEGGGQLGDSGLIIGAAGKLKVVDTQAVDDVTVHIAVPVSGGVKEGDSVRGSIDWDLRYDRMRHHTGSHVLFAAIREVLGLEGLMYMGVQIKEKASRVDISYGKPISLSQLREMERLSNGVCIQNRKVKTWFTTRDEAERTYGKRLGITEVTPFGMVRAVEVEGWDVALCCGTHVGSTAEIGLIKVLERFRLQKGVERIEFTAGEHAYKYYDNAMESLTDLAQLLKSSTREVKSRVEILLEERDNLKEELERTENRLVEAQAIELLNQAEAIGEFRLLKKELPKVDAQGLKRMASTLVNRDSNLIVILGSAVDKACIVGTAGQTAVDKGINMAEMIKEASKIIQGGGGGTAKIAQAGGRDVSQLGQALDRYASDVLTKLRFPL